MSTLMDFLAHNVEGYLFHDIRAMQRTTAAPGEPGGSLGYPLLMSTFAGIELLGALLSHRPFDTTAGAQYFQEYWRDFLYPRSSQPTPEVDAAYRLARHGIAHAFVLKGPLGVLKNQPAFHLTTGTKGEFYIDATQLASDLMESYDKRVKPFLSAQSVAVDPSTMAKRLTEMTSKYESQAKATLGQGPRPSTAQVSSTPSATPVGPSGPLGPVSSSVSRS